MMLATVIASSAATKQARRTALDCFIGPSGADKSNLTHHRRIVLDGINMARDQCNGPLIADKRAREFRIHAPVAAN